VYATAFRSVQYRVYWSDGVIDISSYPVKCPEAVWKKINRKKPR